MPQKDERLFQCLDDRVLSVFLNENIVWREADLSCVHGLAPHDTFCRRFEVTSGIDDDGGLAAELKDGHKSLSDAHTPRPTSRLTGDSVLAAAAHTILATRPLPVYKTIITCICQFPDRDTLKIRTVVPGEFEKLWLGKSAINVSVISGKVITLDVSGIAPRTTRTTSESIYLGMSSAMRPLVAGDSSDGLSRKQLPAAMAPI